VEPVFIPVGSSFRAATDSLAAHGLIPNQGWFKTLARLARYDRKIRAGYYEIPRGESAWRILRTLAEGSEKTQRFTVPEGFTVTDIALAAEVRLGIPADSIRAATRDTALLREFGVDGETLEGHLLPETYFVSKLITGRNLVREMATHFRRAWRPEWDARAAEKGLSRRDLVTMASIVEGEAQVDEDRALVAAVYLNRLRIGMPLQADPTVQYAIQLATGQRKNRLFERDYQFESPFNTYLIPGIPPSPVGAPSVKSIEAVLDPAPVPYLFFVAGPGGKHVFTRTYSEHLNAIARIRAAEREARRAARSQP
ncbi:MAG: endolytic transglycosylase MltG, partial [Gemmatimonadales bacterium]